VRYYTSVQCTFSAKPTFFARNQHPTVVRETNFGVGVIHTMHQTVVAADQHLPVVQFTNAKLIDRGRGGHRLSTNAIHLFAREISTVPVKHQHLYNKER
jgi:hypothetical protein